jgi:hypothetical protein
LSSLGGSTPLIYTIFVALMLAGFAFSRELLPALKRIFGLDPVGWIIVFLIIYVIGGAIIFPRLFAGEAIVYVVERLSSTRGGVVPAPLGPSGGNLTQAGYFTLAALVYFAALAVATQPGGLRVLRTAGFAWALTIAVTGYVDLLAKLAGLGDVFSIIRTAAYSMMTDDKHMVAGLPRINGAFAEASAFAGSAVPACVFTITYWQIERRPAILLLGVSLFVLVALSTSSTAYVTIALCGAWMMGTMVFSIVTGRIRKSDAILLAIGLVGLTVAVAILVLDAKILAQYTKMLEAMVLNKASSSSAMERGNWNLKALEALVATYGFGIGIGSTRTSSWIIAVISQLGLLGAFGMLALMSVMLRGLRGVSLRGADRHTVALASAYRSAALASVLALAISSPSPDLGVFFFLALAAVVASRSVLSRGQPTRSPYARFGSLGSAKPAAQG